jgi:hypothetical protein
MHFEQKEAKEEMKSHFRVPALLSINEHSDAEMHQNKNQNAQQTELSKSMALPIAGRASVRY